jgi:phosphoribosylformylglycinamidine synthase I
LTTTATIARVGIVVFPGSNCELDCKQAFERLGAHTEFMWHDDASLPEVDIVVLPGGFAHGDYLRTGALARFSPIMNAVSEHANRGKLVIGICNGFQILCEAGLLPGAMRKNDTLKFLCKWSELRVEMTGTPFTSRAEAGQVLRVPINHFEGNWYADDATLEQMRAADQILLRYVSNPNGSLDDVAGITNPERNVLGLMPHPERACEALLGSEDGALILGSMLDHAVASGLQPAQAHAESVTR